MGLRSGRASQELREVARLLLLEMVPRDYCQEAQNWCQRATPGGRGGGRFTERRSSEGDRSGIY